MAAILSANKETAASMQTKDRILRAAIDAFNHSSYSRTTTHEIAAAANISPGNLYYHFRNKEKIVKEIFHRMEIFSEQKWYERGPLNSKNGFIDFIRFFFGNIEQYRFFFREFSLIVESVPAMDKLWKIRWNSLMKAMRQAVTLWTEAGILKGFKSQNEIDAFIESCWVLTNFASVHVELIHAEKPTLARQRALELVVRFLYPYHTPKGQRALQLYLDS